ncbi:hypothetical protein NC651_013750 [Populus alba x Populus x berolinensis]|nr:hypothetical protein NC651_013750 [Populus alba x Populus x berolinensis]
MSLSRGACPHPKMEKKLIPVSVDEKSEPFDGLRSQNLSIRFYRHPNRELQGFNSLFNYNERLRLPGNIKTTKFGARYGKKMVS